MIRLPSGQIAVIIIMSVWSLLPSGRASAEPGSLPTVSFHIPTAEAEFQALWFTLNRMSFYREKGYQVFFPRHAYFQALSSRSAPLSPDEKAAASEVFLKEVYQRSSYEKGFERLSAQGDLFPSIFERFSSFSRQWGFETFDHYTVRLTLYGTGGRFDPERGVIIIRTDSAGGFSRDHPLHTIVHEMVHIGIHTRIVQRYHLSHWVKERLVDLICVRGFGDIIPNYRIQPKGDTRMDPFITRDSLSDLPRAVEAYLETRDSLQSAGDQVPVVIVETVFEGTQASAIGLKKGDIILGYDNEEVRHPGDLAKMATQKRQQHDIPLVILRNNRVMQLVIQGGAIGVKAGKSTLSIDALPDKSKPENFR